MARDLWRGGARPDVGDFRVFLGCRCGLDRDHGKPERQWRLSAEASGIAV